MSKKDSNIATPTDATPKAVKPAKGQTSEKSSRSGEKSGISSRLYTFKEYLVLSRAELRKVSWPTWKETRSTSLVVVAFVAVMAILLGLVDLALSSAVRLILS